MSKYHILGAFLTLAAWSSSYVSPTANIASGWQIGGVAEAGVRWTPNPDRGSASSTLSGGRRSASASACALNASEPDPAITLLVPSGDSGLTTAAQPKLSWYLESQNTVDMEFVLSHPDQANPVYSQKIRSGTGLVEVSLPKEAALEEGVRYRWTVFVTCNGGENQIHARSFVKRVTSPVDTAMIANPIDRADAYAVNGIWYDALNTLIDAYRAEASIGTLLEIRNLLAQAKTDVPLELSLAIE